VWLLNILRWLLELSGLSLGLDLRFLIYSGRHEDGLLEAFPRDKGVRFFAALKFVVPCESFLQVIVDKEAHLHHILVGEARKELDQLGLHVFERDDQVINGIVD